MDEVEQDIIEEFNKEDDSYSMAMAEWFEDTIYDACLGG